MIPIKPALARGTLRTIAATTWSEYKKYIEKDPALESRKKTRRNKEKLARFFKQLPAWLVVLIVVLLFGRFAITLVFHLLAARP